ncbi:Lysozyme [Mycena sanguinolenta]|uniref:Lysozyme n=1 Tax=Mycena sanguinolenta TaxID=230812 RepID=A0A8H7CUY5_9AGAR|nr:Lysozyme [Mycena sanguinolenta]
MKLLPIFFCSLAGPLLCVGSVLVSHDVAKRAQPQGIDVSHYQGTVNWASVKAKGISFVYIKATEGTTYRDPNFSANYEGATTAGLIRGAYHFAHPDSSSGAAQAEYFLAHGGIHAGGWSGDGITLPGALDIEYNPGGAECYGLSASAMVSWISDFSSTYHAKTTRYPVIYTTTNWWKTCTGNSAAFANNSPLWIAEYSSSLGALPAGWRQALYSTGLDILSIERKILVIRLFGNMQTLDPIPETRTCSMAMLLGSNGKSFVVLSFSLAATAYKSFSRLFPPRACSIKF